MLKPTDIAAWVGAVTGACVLLWDFYKWKMAGPKLIVSGSTGMKMMPDRDKDAVYVAVRVRNVGTSATTLTTMSLAIYESWFARARLKRKGSRAFWVFEPSQSQRFPFKLDVGEEWTGAVKQNAEMDALIASGKLWCEIYHSWSKQPAFAPIRKYNKTP